MKNKIIERVNNYDFEILQKIGAGSYGTVYKTKLISEAEDKFFKRNREYALKIILDQGEKGIKSLRELDILAKFRHPHLVHSPLIFCKTEGTTTQIDVLMELADADLYSIINKSFYSLDNRIENLYQLCLGLKFLHDNNYLHLDIKPLNILLFKTGKKYTAKLSDFGLSILTENGQKYYPNSLITINYRSPDILAGERIYTDKDDIWSLGITFLEILSGGRSLFGHFAREDFVIQKVLDVFLQKLSDKNRINTLNEMITILDPAIKKIAVTTLDEMLELDPTKRSNIDKVLSSPLFEKFAPIGDNFTKNPVIKENKCGILFYRGFDYLVRLALNFEIKLETFFLAGDLYQKCFYYQPDSIFDFENTIFNAIVCFYMAIKMIEPEHADSTVIIPSVKDKPLFSTEFLILGESTLTNLLKGVIYPKNLFTNTLTSPRLYQAFDLLRNCHVYHNINMNEWYLNNLRELEENQKIKQNTNFNKYMLCHIFLITTNYYSEMEKETNVQEKLLYNTPKYLNEYYLTDMKYEI